MSRKIPPKASVTVSESERGLRDTENGKLVFTAYRGHRCGLLFKNGRLAAACVVPDQEEYAVGAVYIGKIQDVARNIDACFVEIGEDMNCFLPGKNALSPFLANRPFQGRLWKGDEILVQIDRDAKRTKQPSVTARISLANDFFALILGSSKMSFSSKLSRERRDAVCRMFEERGLLRDGCLIQDPVRLLPDEEERKRLAAAGLIPSEGEGAGTDTTETPPGEDAGRFPAVGVIVRTGLREERLEEEQVLASFYELTGQLYRLFRTALTRSCPSCLIEAPKPWEAALQSLAYPEEYQEIVTDSQGLYGELAAYCKEHLPDKEIRLYEDKSLSLAKLYSVESRLDEALRSRVWLKSGGYLVIEPTEALTAIDVNSGKCETGQKAADALYRLNREAAGEIARQLRLRNLSGMILVDFINMQDREKERELLEYLRVLTRQDRVSTTVVDITPLGLVEITRKRVNPPLSQQLGEREETYEMYRL